MSHITSIRFVYSKRIDGSIQINPKINLREYSTTSDLRRLAKEYLRLQVPYRYIVIVKPGGHDMHGNITPSTTYEPSKHTAFIQDIRNSCLEISIARFSLGKYVCTGEELGSGSFSQVYKGVILATNEQVAIKVIDAQLLVNHKAKEYHENEKKILQLLQHSNVSRLEEKEGDFFYFVMEYCTGGSLESHIAGKSLPEATARRCLAQLASALKHLYSNHIIHRDLKPGNILLTSPNICDATLKLCDFGFSRVFSPHDLMQSYPLSPLYAAPQLLNHVPYDPRSDLWSVGAIFFEMLTGRPLFQVQTMEELQRAINSKDYVKIPPEILVNLSKECVSLVHLLLQFDQSKRITWEQFFEHPFLRDVTTRAIFHSHTGEGYEILASEHDNVLGLKNALARQACSKPSDLVILVEDSKGTELPNHLVLRSERTAWQSRLRMYLFDLKNTLKPAALASEFPVEAVPAQQPLCTSATDVIIRGLLEIEREFRGHGQTLTSILEACKKTVAAHRTVVNPTKNQMKSMQVLCLNLEEAVKDLETGAQVPIKLFRDTNQQATRILQEFDAAVEKLKRTETTGPVRAQGKKTLWDCVDLQRVTSKYDTLKELNVELSRYFSDLTRLLEEVKVASCRKPLLLQEEEARAIRTIKISDQLIRDTFSAIEVCDLDRAKVAHEVEKERAALMHGQPARTDYYECYKTMIDSSRLQMERAEEAYRTITRNYQATLQKRNEVTQGVTAALQLRTAVLSTLDEISAKSQRMMDYLLAVQTVTDEVMTLATAYDHYNEEMSRRRKFEENLVKKAEKIKQYFDRQREEENVRLVNFNRNFGKSLNSAIFPNVDVTEQNPVKLSIPDIKTPADFTRSDDLQDPSEDFDAIMAEFEDVNIGDLQRENQGLREQLEGKHKDDEALKICTTELARAQSLLARDKEERLSFFQQYEQRYEIMRRKMKEAEAGVDSTRSASLASEMQTLRDRVAEESNLKVGMLQQLEQEKSLRRQETSYLKAQLEHLKMTIGQQSNGSGPTKAQQDQMLQMKSRLDTLEADRAKMVLEHMTQMKEANLRHGQMSMRVTHLEKELEDKSKKLNEMMQMTQCPLCSKMLPTRLIQDHTLIIVTKREYFLDAFDVYRFDIFKLKAVSRVFAIIREGIMAITRDDLGLLIAAASNSVVALITFLIFCLLRNRFPSFYSPISHSWRYELTRSTLGWPFQLLRQFSLTAVLRECGPDVYMYIRFLRTSLRIFFAMTLLSLITLIPTNATGQNTYPGENSWDDPIPYEGLDKITLNNIPSGSQKQWVHLFFIFISTFWILWNLHWDYKEFARLRCNVKEARTAQNSTVLFTRMPITNEEEALAYVQSMLPPSTVQLSNPPAIAQIHPTIKSINLVHDAEELRKLQAEFDETSMTLDRYQFLQGASGETLAYKPKSLTHPFGDKSKEVPAIPHFQRKLDEIRDRIAVLQNNFTALPHKRSAFVTFHSRNTAKMFAQSVISPTGGVLSHAVPAPDPNAVLWKYIGINSLSFWVREAIVNTFLWAMTLLWTFPILFLSSFTTIDNLNKIVPDVVTALQKNQALYGFVSGFLPVILTVVFLALVPTIVRAIVNLRHLWSQTLVDDIVTKKLFTFYYVNVLLAFLVGPVTISLIQDSNELTVDGVMNILAREVPARSRVMIIYVITSALSVFPGALLRVVPFLLWLIKHKYINKTTREHAKTDEESVGHFDYSLRYAKELVVFAIVLTYSTISPFILLWGLLYFFLAYFTSIYNLQYVYRSPFSSGGFLWISTFDRILFSLFLYHLVMAATFVANGFEFGPIVLILIPILFFFRNIMHSLYRNRSLHGTLNPYTTHDLTAEGLTERSALITHEEGNESGAYVQKESTWIGVRQEGEGSYVSFDNAVRYSGPLDARSSRM
ncbi:hypothetical protein PROFUN_00079 [Planoprotostelium fungivorum]|uniref:Protein kinase domain-containing protein n=1 Tax=Planoprotostelium fungivorum TaxID=1890364 RepID=A0A2P6P0L6_9EUKA|nr:hypothetical protein PROFUN_00079 [Planoprotostelium fungivorum]